MYRENILGLSEFKEVLLGILDFTDEFYDNNWEDIDNMITSMYNYYYNGEVTSVKIIANIVLITMGTFLNDD